MNRQLIVIYVWRGKAYLPTKARFESGIWVDIEPVFITDLDAESLVSAAARVLAAGHPRLPDPTDEEWKKRKDPVLTTAKARSWKQMARTGAAYTIGWTDQQIRIDISRLDSKGRWEYDLEKVRILTPDTPLEEIIAVVIEDIQSRPELFEDVTTGSDADHRKRA